MKSLDKLGYADFDELDEDVEDSSLDNFRVIVKTSRFDTMRDIPEESLAQEDRVSGLVVNQISSLGRQERDLLRESFPELDFDKLIILAEGREPSSPSQSFGMMSGGGVLLLFGLGLGLFTLRQ